MNDIASTSEKIHAKCIGCIFGYDDLGRTRCTYWTHPGYVGGVGTEWALTCGDYQPDNKKGRIEVRLVRE